MKADMQNKVVEDICPESLVNIFKRDWKWCLLGGVISFVLASVLMSGWPEGLLPNLHYPYLYGGGDDLGVMWQIQRCIEGWIFDNPRSGYPFGSTFLDYPSSDNGNFLFLKFGGMLFGSFYAALNVYFLTGFVVIFVCAFCVMRSFKIAISLSFVAALLFNFLPFHFWRIGHLFYTWYFVVPLYFYFGLWAYTYTRNVANRLFLFSMIIPCGVIAILSSFGVYYALFGVITVLVAGLAGALNHNRFRPFVVSLFLAGALVFGVLLNLTPNILNVVHDGYNSEAVQRTAQQSEIFGLKLVQLLLPRADHRFASLGQITRHYNAVFPLVNENRWATLGFVGGSGFILLILILFCHGGRGWVNEILFLLSLIVVILCLVSTVGGFGVLFAMFISPAIRSWNRASIFIGFGAITAFFVFMEILLKRIFMPKKHQIVIILFAVICLVLGLMDQTVNINRGQNKVVKQTFLRDKRFIANIESSLPKDAAIYQLPYIPFPEAALHELNGYSLAAGFIHSKTLRWSFAGMKGREGDLFYRFLSKEPLPKQLEIIKKLGFQGIYIDKRGYKDYGKDIIHKIILQLKTLPTVTREDEAVVFFKLNSVPMKSFENLSPMEIMHRVGYVVDEFGPRYSATLSEGLDFRKNGLPLFVKRTEGFSVPESWGRWSDANIHPSAIIEFDEQLPRRFTIYLIAQAYGPNVGKNLTVKVGTKKYYIPISSQIFEAQLEVDLGDDNATTVELIPPAPISPQEYKGIKDPRKLGIGLTVLKIIEK